jgi:Bifunctional DNA primase/polymerase, N-terminal
MTTPTTKPAPRRPVHPGDAALACARRGWRVFPLSPGDKRPVHGFTDWENHATADPARIRAFWARARFNVGIACGPSGLVVVDLDTPKPGQHPPPGSGPGINDGADALAALCETHRQPFPADTFTVITRRGGMHLYFTAPPDVELRNTAGRLGWLIDTRATGGYVVAPGSHVQRPDGTGTYTVSHPTPPAPLPHWITHLLTPPPAPTPPLSALSGPDVANLDAYTRQALKGEAERITHAQVGERNWALNKAAYNLGRLVAAHALTEDTARTVLWDAAQHHFTTGPNAFTPTEATATITAGLTAGTHKPRTLTTRNAA